MFVTSSGVMMTLSSRTLPSLFTSSYQRRGSHSQLTPFCRYGVGPGPDAGRLPLQSRLPWTLQHVPEVHASKTHPPRPPPLLQGRSPGPQLQVPVQAFITTPAQTHVHVYQRSSRLCCRPCSKLSDWVRLTTSLVWPECSSGPGRWGFICRLALANAAIVPLRESALVILAEMSFSDKAESTDGIFFYVSDGWIIHRLCVGHVALGGWEGRGPQCPLGDNNAEFSWEESINRHVCCWLHVLVEFRL